MEKEKLLNIMRKAEPILKRYRYPILVLFAGLLILALGAPQKEAAPASAQEARDAASADGTAQDGGFDLTAFEEKLQQDVSRISGVGRVSLSLSLKSTEEAVYAADIRQSSQNTETTSYESALSIVSDGSYGQQPILVKKQYPTFRGALVLCDGADNDTVRLAVTDAVSTMCGIGADKVSVLKMQS
ncbi:hypothetical protein LI291_00185 [Intestinibacillus massiliensis]|nr:hypothetical protein [Intestinibacillus massiliensis]